MRISRIPLLAQIRNTGADDRVFDALLFVGPVVIVLIRIIGRSILTGALALAYLAVFLGYILYGRLR